jgi:hypothetical protein
MRFRQRAYTTKGRKSGNAESSKAGRWLIAPLRAALPDSAPFPVTVSRVRQARCAEEK